MSKRASVFGKRKESTADKIQGNGSNLAIPPLDRGGFSSAIISTTSNSLAPPSGMVSPRSAGGSISVSSLDKKTSRTATVGTLERLGSSTHGSGGSLGRKKSPVAKERSVTGPPVMRNEPSEYKAVKMVLSYFLKGMHMKDQDIFDVVSTALSKMPDKFVPKGQQEEREALDNLIKSNITIGAMIEEQRKVCAAILIQSQFRRYSCRKRYLAIRDSPIGPFLATLSHILKVEQDYFDKLTTISKNYTEPLHAKGILDNATLDSLFSKVETIRSIHGRIIQHVLIHRSNPAKWKDLHTLASFFLGVSASFSKSYTEYASDYAYLMEKIDSLQASNPKFESFMLEVTRASAKQNHPLLLQLLALPLNHISSVEAYLDKLSELTEPPARDDIVCALAILQQTVSFVSKKREDMFYETQMIRLSKKIIGEQQQLSGIFNGSRRLIKEGELLSDKATKRQVYLLSDFCLICRPNSDPPQKNNAIKTFILEKVIALEGCSFSETPTFDGGRRFRGQDTDAMAFEFKNNDGTHRLYATTAEDKKVWIREIKTVVDQCNKTRVFGVPLETLLEREKRKSIGVPVIVERLVNHIKDSGMKEEGLMRVSGVHSEIATLRQMVDRGEAATISLSDYSLPTVCSLLKLYFRELPEPLLTFDLYDPLVALQEQEDMELDQRLNIIQSHIRKIPSQNRKLLKYILRFLLNIATCSEFNKMTPTNLSIVMTPGLIRARTQTTKSALQAPLANSLTELLIEFCEDIFSDMEAGSIIVKSGKRLTGDQLNTRSIKYKRLSTHFKKFQQELEEALHAKGTN